MAIALDASSQGSNNNTTSLTISHTIGSGADRVLYVFVASNDNTPDLDTATVTYGGTSLGSSIATVFGSSMYLHIWRMTNPPTGTANIVISNSMPMYLHCYASSWTGVDQATPNGTVATYNIASSSSPRSLAVTAATDGVVVDFLHRRVVASSLTPDATQTRIGTELSAVVATSGSSYKAASGATNMVWTQASGSGISHMAVPLNPASGGADLTGSITLADLETSGSLASNVALLTGDLSIADVLASGALGLVPGSIRTLPFARNNGTRPTGLINVALAVLSDDASLLRLAGSAAIVQNGDGTISFSGAGLPGVGASVIVITREPDGKIGAERYLVT